MRPLGVGLARSVTGSGESMYDIGFGQALEIIKKNVSPLGPESVFASDVVGRVCGTAVKALVDYPSDDASLKDGYAVRSEDVSAASPENPVTLQVVGVVSAGDSCRAAVENNTAVRVSSGALIPQGASAVLAEELAEVSANQIKALACAEPGRNILFRGSEISQGATLVQQGQTFTPTRISLVVAGGHERVSVYRLPKVGLLATGDEILLPGAPLKPGMVFAGNIALQQAWMRYKGIHTTVRRAGDSLDDLGAAITDMLTEADVLITSGGAWKGDRDLIVKVLDALGWHKLFHRVRIGPGKAAAFGLLDGKPVFCLPGGPPSNEVAFLTLAFPAVLQMAGHTQSPFLHLTGIPEQGLSGQKDWTQAVFCLARRKDQAIYLTPLETRPGLMPLSNAYGLVLIPEGVETVPAGTAIEFISLSTDPTEL